MLAEKVDATTLADRTGYIVAQALGADIELPDPGVRRAQFDELLLAPDRPVDPETELIMRIMGLRPEVR